MARAPAEIMETYLIEVGGKGRFDLIDEIAHPDMIDEANQAFGAARRAILRCGARGFQLPSDKYAQWRNIEMTFNPERMRNR